MTRNTGDKAIPNVDIYIWIVYERKDFLQWYPTNLGSPKSAAAGSPVEGTTRGGRRHLLEGESSTQGEERNDPGIWPSQSSFSDPSTVHLGKNQGFGVLKCISSSQKKLWTVDHGLKDYQLWADSEFFYGIFRDWSLYIYICIYIYFFGTFKDESIPKNSLEFQFLLPEETITYPKLLLFPEFRGLPRELWGH